MKSSRIRHAVLFTALATLSAALFAYPQAASQRGWQRGKGWGWIWGKDDEVGALNAMTDASRLAALSLVKQGKVLDLGVPYDRSSFKWPGHSPGEVMTFRSPEGVKRQADVAVLATDRSGAGWHSCALFISDNVGTQIDGLGHVTRGADNSWYNGFKEADHGGDFGIRKCSADGIPPIVVPGVLIDVAGWKKVEHLPPHYAIGAEDLRATLAWEKADIQPGDAVFIRTGTLSRWGVNGSDVDTLKEIDTAGIDIGAARWLIEEKGAILIGADTSGLEVAPAPEGSQSFIPVHLYLLIEQGVHVGEFHNLEALAREKVYRFCYLAVTNKIRGAVAGFTMRPVAMY